MDKIWIGIDPDVEKNGVATWYNNEIIVYNMTFFELFDFLYRMKNKPYEGYPDVPITVAIEAGWENKKTNWQYEGANRRIANKVSSRIGANHETGKKIVEMCKYLKVSYILCVPSKTKMKQTQFAMLTKYKKRTNQEQRDAAMLVFARSNKI